MRTCDVLGVFLVAWIILSEIQFRRTVKRIAQLSEKLRKDSE